MACADAPAVTVPTRQAVIQEDDGVVSSITFQELASASSALASRLVAEGVKPRENIGVYAPAGTIAAIAHIAVLKAGAVTVPLVPLLGDGAIEHRLTDAQIGVLLVAPELLGRAMALVDCLEQRVSLLVLTADAFEQSDATSAFVAARTTADDPAMILYTSGTTGMPKGAVQAHRVILARHAPLSMIHGPFAPDDVFWTPADWMWMGSLVDSVLGPLTYGCTVFTYARRRFEVEGAIRRLKEFGVTRAFIPPTALRQLMEAPAEAWEGHTLRSIHSGGEALTADAFTWAQRVLGVTVDEIYGMTEVSFVAGNAHRYHPVVSGSMGRPFPGQGLRIVDAEGRSVINGAVGELQIRETSPSLFLGYYGKPEETAARFCDGWFSTGDLVRSDEAGRLFFVGRRDDLIMSSGHRIGPGEIEDALRSHTAVREAVVVGQPDPERGQQIKAVVELHDSTTDPPPELTQELQDLVRTRVGRHAYPRAVEYLAELPRTVTGKVRRDLLRLAPSQRDGVSSTAGEAR